MSTTHPFPAAAAGQPPSSRRRARTWPVALAVWGAVLLNELFSAGMTLVDHFGGAKVVSSLRDELAPLLATLTWEAVQMVTVAALLALPPCALAAASCRAAWTRLDVRWGAPRALRWSSRFVLLFAWLNVWYTLHEIVLPASRLAASPLATLAGTPDDLGAGGAGTPWLLLLTVPIVLVSLVVALVDGRTLRRMTLAVTTTGALAVAAWSLATAPGDPRPFTSDGHLVLLGLDSFQLNRLASGGCSDGLTPHIDGFLERSFRFENAWTPFARTYPSWMSLLTGRFPPAHGLRFNLGPDGELSPDNRYLAGELAAAGYATFHATDETRFSLIRPRFGYQRLLHPPFGARDFLLGTLFDFSVANLLRRTALGHDLFAPIAHNRAVPSYDPDLFVRALIRELDALPRDRPVFANVHLCGNHWPFATPAPWAWTGGDAIDGCIAMVDDQVGRILDYLDRSGLSARATVVMLSDHGDGWSGDPEDTTNTHGDHLDTPWSNRIVLGMAGPDIAAGRSSELVRIVDLYATLLERTGLPVRDPRSDSRSLVPLLTGGRVEPRPLFAESGIGASTFDVKQALEDGIGWYEMDPETGLVFLRPDGVAAFLPHKSYMLLESDRRLVVTPAIGRFQLFAVDPLTGEDTAHLTGTGGHERQALLTRLAEHNGLDEASLTDLARSRGFLE